MTETTDLAIYDHRVKSTNALVRAVRDTVVNKHTIDLNGKRYVRVAGGTAIANAMGLSVREASCVWRAETSSLPAHWEAVAEVVEIDGTVVGRGSGRVFLDEPRWSRSPMFACAAMAGTRAAARALRYVLGHIYVALEISDTPAEEIEAVNDSAASLPPPAASAPSASRTPTRTEVEPGSYEVTITSVDHKDGVDRNGKPWRKYRVTAAEIGPCFTFNADHAEIARRALDSGTRATVEVVRGRYGLDLRSISSSAIADLVEAEYEAEGVL